ncbi:MAG: sulfite exporter TauE/SafE family protein [Nitrososphaeraceae archaeon]
MLILELGQNISFLYFILSDFYKNFETTIPISILILGLLTGIRHSFEADHVAAVSTIMVNEKSKKLTKISILGAIWGLGHTIALFIGGIVVLFLSINIPEQISNTLEFGVGIMLIYLAIITLTGFKVTKFLRTLINKGLEHIHPHKHGVIIHTHEHKHDGKDHNHGHKALIIGMIHGIAGTGAVMLVVLASIDSPLIGLAYIGLFGIGSILSMMVVTTIIGIPISKFTNSKKVSILIKYTIPIITLIIGLSLIYELAFVDKIFEI